MDGPLLFVEILSGGFVLLGALLLIAALLPLWYARRSTIWPRTSGVVHSRRQRGTVLSTLDGSQSIYTYTVEVKYWYNVGGVVYKSDRVRFGRPVYATRETAGRRLKQIRPGQAIDVYYHPRRPGLAVLEPGICALDYTSAAAGAGAILVGLLALWLVI